MTIRPHPVIPDIFTADHPEDFVGWTVEAVTYDPYRVNFCLVVISHISAAGRIFTKTVHCPTAIVPFDAYRRKP